MTRKSCIKRLRALSDAQYEFVEAFLEDHLEEAESADWNLLASMRPISPST